MHIVTQEKEAVPAFERRDRKSAHLDDDLLGLRLHVHGGTLEMPYSPSLQGIPEMRRSINSVSTCSSDTEDSSSSTEGETQQDDSVSLESSASCDAIADSIPWVKDDEPESSEGDKPSFMALRATYLLVTFVIMLADGLQGTHLYVLYEGYGFSVASLYCLGFVTGGIVSPITGPLADKMGRKKAAILYCVLEIFINMLEQYPYLPGLIVSRMIGGLTTNLLTSVFETWLDTEYRRRGLEKEKYEIIMRDSVIVSNIAAIYSGYLAHVLAESYGPVGPFGGAVASTAIALAVVLAVWTENYGGIAGDENEDKGVAGFLREAVDAFKADKKMRTVGIIQGLTAGSLQIFVFLWSPALRHFSMSASNASLGLDSHGEPAYGLIFGAYMVAGVLGGLVAPWVRKCFTTVLSPVDSDDVTTVDVDGEVVQIRPMAVEFLAASCYFIAALLLMVPFLAQGDGPTSFAASLAAFLMYEFLIGVYLPCEGVIRSLYFPANARASVMTLPRIIVNAAVSVGVASTNFISFRMAFLGVACLMLLSGALQLSLISQREWSSLWSRADVIFRPVLRISRCACGAIRRRCTRSSGGTNAKAKYA